MPPGLIRGHAFAGIALSARYEVNQKTVAKWRKRISVADLPTGPRDAKSTVLTLDEEAIIVALTLPPGFIQF